MKIEKLIDYLKTNFPNGCEGTECEDCPLNITTPGTIKDKLCDFLAYLHDTDSVWRD